LNTRYADLTVLINLHKNRAYGNQEQNFQSEQFEKFLKIRNINLQISIKATTDAKRTRNIRTQMRPIIKFQTPELRGITRHSMLKSRHFVTGFSKSR